VKSGNWILQSYIFAVEYHVPYFCIKGKSKMSYKLFHINSWGQICTQSGDLYLEGSTSKTEFFFESLEDVQIYAKGFTNRHKNLGCLIINQSNNSEEYIYHDESHLNALHKYNASIKKDRRQSIIICTTFWLFFILNIVLSIILAVNVAKEI